jgi:hypothetical protein
MTDDTLAARTSRWRARAEEITVRAEAMRDAEAQRMMLELAATYVGMAEQAERGADFGYHRVDVYKVINEMQTQLLDVAGDTRLHPPQPLE